MHTVEIDDCNGTRVEVDFHIINKCNGCAVTPPYAGDVEIIDIRVLDSIGEEYDRAAIDDLHDGMYDDHFITCYG